MATKKKLPHSRRCKNQETLGLYCYCGPDKEECGLQPGQKPCCAVNDVPDRVYGRGRRIGSDTSDITTTFHVTTYSDEPKFDDDLNKFHRRSLPPHDGHSDVVKIYEAPSFDLFDILVGMSSVVFFYFDIITDIVLARDYYKTNNVTAFTLTAVFIVGPSLITCILNFRWYLLDYQSQQIMVKNHGKDNVKETSTILWIARFCMTLLMMGPVIRQLEYIYNGIKSNSSKLSPEEKKRHYQVMRMEDVDACCIRMFECFLEAAPQLVLQIFILMTHRKSEALLTEILRAAAILSSWISLAWSMVSYQKALRFSHEDKQNMSIPGLIFYFLWRACEIGPRVIALGLFASLFHHIALIVVIVHWILMSSWLFCQKTKFYENRCEEKFFNIVCGYVLVFCFLNVRDGRTRYRMVMYYFIVCSENWTMVGFWFYFTDDKSAWFYLPAFFIIVLSIFLQLFFQMTYYGCLHPLGRGKIPCCLKGGEYNCYQSLCHDLEENGDTQYYMEAGPTPAPV